MGAQSSIITILLFSSLILFVMGVIAWFIWKLMEQRRQENAAMQTFEREFEGEFIRPGGALLKEAPSSATEQPPALSAPPAFTTQPGLDFREQRLYPPKESKDVSSPAVPFVSEPSAQKTPPSLSPVDQLIARLKGAGLLDSSEGPYMPLDPSGACILVNLKRGKTALIVPRFESEFFLSQALRRFDYVFLISSQQETVVLSKMSDYIASHYQMR